MEAKPNILWIQDQARVEIRSTLNLLSTRCSVLETSPTYVWIDLEGKETTFDLIILYIDGFPFFLPWMVEKLRLLEPATKLILVTSRPTLELLTWALRSGIHDVFSLPLVIADVMDACTRAITNHRERRNLPLTAPPAAGKPAVAPPSVAARTSRRERLQKVKARFEKNLGENLSEDAGALICHVSKGCFSRSFKHEFGMSFIKYKSQYRIARAKELLAIPSLSISDVSALVGISDPSYFARAFREAVGTTPSRWKASTCASQPATHRSNSVEQAQAASLLGSEAQSHPNLPRKPQPYSESGWSQ